MDIGKVALWGLAAFGGYVIAMKVIAQVTHANGGLSGPYGGVTPGQPTTWWNDLRRGIATGVWATTPKLYNRAVTTDRKSYGRI